MTMASLDTEAGLPGRSRTGDFVRSAPAGLVGCLRLALLGAGWKGRVVTSGRPSVAIVGAGPAGLVCALTLADYDVDVVLLDKRAGTGEVSRALVASTRTMELLRRFGFEPAVHATAVKVDVCAWITDDLSSGAGTRQPLGYLTGAEGDLVSPTRALWAPQHLWEPLLLQRLQTLPNVEVRLRCAAQSFAVTTDGAVVEFFDELTGRGRLRADFVVAGDGAHSAVRRAVGIPMDGPDDLSEVDRVEFRADVESVLGRLACGLTVVTDPEVGGVLAPRSRGRWGITRDSNGSSPRFTAMDARQRIEYVRRLLGAPALHVEIEGVRTFRFAAQLATAFRSGPVLLAGDAAHRVTPRGGTGMNMALQDGFDIGWKLGFVLSGWAPPALLDTYETERRPIAAHNVERSARPSGAIQAADEALRWDLDGRIEHHWVAPGRSTVDLPGTGLTLLTGLAASCEVLGGSGPVDVHRLDADTCDRLGLPHVGGLLLRPDGKLIRRWDDLPSVLDAWSEFARAATRGHR